ncbi:MAG: hypothetical protein GC181_07800 [Bacteroidetes bacterium]|nr:hypothetical protein [Bacteroidota bacterium]
MKTCNTCGRDLKGRADKKFCNYQCRNRFHNHRSYGTIAMIRDINNRLRQNHRILISYLDSSKNLVRKRELQNSGFDFSYYTKKLTVDDGQPCYFCYDVGYFPHENDYFALIARDDTSDLTR